MHKERVFVRINKYISETGICSRREADKLIEERRVKINGKIAEMGSKVEEGDIVQVDGKPIGKKKPLVYIALNKPVGITCTTERNVHGNIIDFVNHKERIFHIGRLDKDSDGLILLTNDGDIVNKILRSENEHEKEYIVTVDKPITERFIQAMSSGVKILGRVTKPCKVNKIRDNVFQIILTQGLNRQIRRMCEALGYNVVRLQRVRIMNIKLGNLPLGQWRDLSDKELNELFRQLNYKPEHTIVKSETVKKDLKKDSQNKRVRNKNQNLRK
ncbi:23S rRNA pseudouridine(2604) synthase RluF [Fervidicella metallireducens]|uniref:23S rRNA pseudouridine(2604) synthase RluF n=1 Tax=Fervidicella metallireducens TaxID=655338 RepID=UPI00191C08E9|nr:23S rRNA pseudouridine(2604) synthase RluF [Fervidicella metallireducens]